MSEIINLTEDNINDEHICCAISDKKCIEGYNLKKDWLKKEFKNNFVFKRLDERAKVFIEYGESEKAWAPIAAKNCLFIQCFWVSGSYKNKGYGKSLLNMAIEDAKSQGKDAVLIIVGTKNKMHFMSDGKWLLKQGFVEIDKTQSGFSLLSYKISDNNLAAKFKKQVMIGQCDNKNGITVYYTNRCPFTDYHINYSLQESVSKRNLNLEIIYIKSLKEAQNSPAPSTIFSLFYNGNFITTDLSCCMDTRFDKNIIVT